MDGWVTIKEGEVIIIIAEQAGTIEEGVDIRAPVAIAKVILIENFFKIEIRYQSSIGRSKSNWNYDYDHY